MSTAVRRRGDKGRSIRDDGGYPADRSSGTEPAMTSSHHDPISCQWFSRLAAVFHHAFPYSGIPYLTLDYHHLARPPHRRISNPELDFMGFSILPRSPIFPRWYSQ